MTPEQVKNFAMDSQVVGREVTVIDTDDEKYVGRITFTGQNKFRLDTPLAACFFEYNEVQEAF